MSGKESVIHAAASSFLAMFLGWLLAVGTLVVNELADGGYSWFEDRAFWLVWPGIIMLLAWAFVVLPLLAFGKTRRLLSHPKTACVSWTALAVISFAALVLTWMPAVHLLWFPIVAGLTAGITFPRILKSSMPSLLQVVIPILIVLACVYVIWPMAMRHAPRLVYSLGSLEEQQAMMDQLIMDVREGMTFEELSDCLPLKTEEPFLSMSGSSKSYDYTIFLEEGVVTRLRIEVKR